ncbi:hypothetical protein [Flavobacterium sp.]|uniref:hypothetical protein n=1 Tax=Flavobacterium sp. TaxID=239 RepID=UPI0037533BD1
MKKNVLIVALAFGIFFTSCKKEIETSAEEITTEQMTPEVVDGVVTDTVAPMVEPKDSISKK